MRLNQYVGKMEGASGSIRINLNFLSSLRRERPLMWRAKGGPRQVNSRRVDQRCRLRPGATAEAGAGPLEGQAGPRGAPGRGHAPTGGQAREAGDIWQTRGQKPH